MDELREILHPLVDESDPRPPVEWLAARSRRRKARRRTTVLGTLAAVGLLVPSGMWIAGAIDDSKPGDDVSVGGPDDVVTPDEPVVVVDQGFTVAEDVGGEVFALTYGVVVRNTGDTPVEGVLVVARFLDAAGVVVGSDATVVTALGPGQEIGVGKAPYGSGTAGVNDLTTEMAVEVVSSPRTEPLTGEITTTGADTSVNTSEQGDGLTTTFTASSTSADGFEQQAAWALYLDAAGGIIGGAEGSVFEIPAGGSGQGEAYAPIVLDGIAASRAYVDQPG